MNVIHRIALCAVLLHGVHACAKASVVGTTSGTNGGSSSNSSSSAGGSGGATIVAIDLDAASAILSSDAGTSGTTSQVIACGDGGGDACTCSTVTVAVLGKSGKWGASTSSANNDAGDGDKAFIDWLNSSSSGTAKVDIFTNRVTLTSDFLAAYQVIILQGLAEDSNNGPWWSYSDAEIQAVEDWVNNGGGLITLSGMSGSDSEVVPTNQLISYSGISYNKDDIRPDCAVVDSSGNAMCWCGGSSPITKWNRTDSVIANLSYDVTMVGIAGGRSINAPSDAHVAATEYGFSDGGAQVNLLMGKLIGNGRVLVFTDEWITYTSQWNGEGNANSSNSACKGYLPQDVYQTAQFWYNMIRWVQPNASCFVITDNQQSVTIW